MPPTTPETPRRLAVNRSFTVPSKLATTSRTGPDVEIGATKDVETLYIHPHASIIKFSIPPGSRPSSSSSPRSPQQSSSGTLPWSTRTERTLASGPLEIYRVPGSVSFLHSGTLLHAILPRSQCWCVDGISKFTMRVLPETYYRIELPAETPGDLEKVEELKGVLAKVLFYERTACPFNRGGQEEVRPSVEDLDQRRMSRRISVGPAKKWRLEGRYSWMPEDGRAVRWEDGAAEDSSGREDSEVEQSDGAREASGRMAGMANGVERLTVQTPIRPSGLENMRSVTAPVQIPQALQSLSRIRVATQTDAKADPVSLAQARHSPSALRTFQAIPTDMPPSPPESSAGMEEVDYVGDDAQEEEASAVPQQSSPRATSPPKVPTVQRRTPEPVSASAPQQRRDASPIRPFASSPPTARDAPVEHELPLTRQRTPEDPFAAIQARILARRSIGTTPAPVQPQPTQTQAASQPSSAISPISSTSSASTSSTLTSRPHLLRTQTTLATALVNKAVSVFLGPPAQLVAIMLKIAARLTNDAAGVGSWFLFESPAGARRTVPGSFDLDDLELDDVSAGEEGEDGDGLAYGGVDSEEDDDGEDDFGVPLRSPVRRLASRGLS